MHTTGKVQHPLYLHVIILLLYKKTRTANIISHRFAQHDRVILSRNMFRKIPPTVLRPAGIGVSDTT